MTYLTLRSKIVNLNNLKNNILAGVIEESMFDFEDTIDVKGGLSNTK